MKLVLLSDYFFDTYQGCDEILSKRTRPYVCLSVVIDGVQFAIPFRHHITHKWAYITYGTCGLDYTKAVVISDWRFVSITRPTIEQAEWDALKGKDARVQNGMKQFLTAYRKAVQYPDNPNYSFIRGCTALQYFHRELGIG